MNNPEYKNIAIIRLSSLGDIVHTIPAFSLLRKQFPQAKICWFAESTGAKLLENISGINEIVSINLKVKGVFNKVREILRVVSSHRKQFDLVIDFQGLLKSAVLGWMLRGETIGFGKNNLREPQARFFYKHQVNSFDEKSHVILKNIHLLNGLLTKAVAPIVDYPLRQIPFSLNLKNFLSQHNLEKNQFIIINIGGGWESKLLSVSQHVELVKRIKETSNLPVVILWGTRAEREVAHEIATHSNSLMADFLNFSELILFIKHSKLIVTADTLALHVADMVNTPSVSYFGPTSPDRNGSLLKESISIYEKLDCSFCYKKKCGKIDCIKNINLDLIINAIEKINEKYD